MWRAVRRRAILIVYPPPAGRLRRKGWDRMNEALAYVVAQRMERTAAALRKNNMAAYCVKTADEVVTPCQNAVGRRRDVARAAA